MNLAKFFNHDFKNGDFILYDKNNNEVYFEDSKEFWWEKEFDENNNEIYFKNSNKYWWERKYDKNNNAIYFEDSYGKIIDNRPKCIDKIIEIDGKKYKLKEI